MNLGFGYSDPTVVEKIRRHSSRFGRRYLVLSNLVRTVCILNKFIWLKFYEKKEVIANLNDESFSSPSGCVSNHGHVLSLVDEVVETVEHTATGGRSSTVNTAL